MNELDISKLSIEQIDKLLTALKEKQEEYQNIIDEQYNKEQAIKLVMNSIYGATGNTYQTFFDTNIAEAVTLQGKELILYAEKVLNHYFTNLWLTDTKLHEKLGIKIKENASTNESVVYIDTDSVISTSIIHTNDGSFTIEDVYNFCKNHYDISIDIRNNEIININGNINVLNYNEKLKYVPIKKLIRHKVTKPKWKIKTKSGKEVIVTNDHSIIVFRDGKQLSIKASEINIKTDKILSVSEYIT